MIQAVVIKYDTEVQVDTTCLYLYSTVLCPDNMHMVLNATATNQTHCKRERKTKKEENKDKIQ